MLPHRVVDAVFDAAQQPDRLAPLLPQRTRHGLAPLVYVDGRLVSSNQSNGKIKVRVEVQRSMCFTQGGGGGGVVD